MRKFIISISIIGIFIAYSLMIRHRGPVIMKSSSLSINNTRSSTTGNTNSSNNTSSSSTNSNISTTTSGQYNDGTYIGSVDNAYYGNVQVSATITNGKITSVDFLQYPNTHPTSVSINQQAIPLLQQEAIQAQNSKVQIITGATFTSQAFAQSLSSALRQAD